jgi:hypothetical protein
MASISDGRFPTRSFLKPPEAAVDKKRRVNKTNDKPTRAKKTTNSKPIPHIPLPFMEVISGRAQSEAAGERTNDQTK